jgi:streptogramin lyase
MWIGDHINHRLIKLNPVAHQFTYWQLPYKSYPEGLALDSSGNLWWAEKNFPLLGRLEAAASRLTTYPLPVGGGVNMITISGGAIWYTERVSDTFGVMNPNTASSSSATITSATVAVSPSCTGLGAGVTFTPVISTGVAEFTSGVLTPMVDSGGWTVYQLPSPTSSLWGIAKAEGVWISDRGRDKLIWFAYSTYLPIIFK